MHKHGPLKDEVDDIKLVINKKTEQPNSPPYQNKGTIALENVQLKGETDLVRRQYRENGSGNYTILWTAPGQNGLKLAWKAEITKENDRLNYMVEENNLRDFITTKTQPWTDKIKSVEL